MAEYKIKYEDYSQRDLGLAFKHCLGIAGDCAFNFSYQKGQTVFTTQSKSLYDNMIKDKYISGLSIKESRLHLSFDPDIESKCEQDYENWLKKEEA